MAKKFRKLIRSAMRQVKCDKKITEHGIEFERMKDGDGRFAINIMVDGVRIHRVLGKESEGITRHNAEHYIEAVRTEARNRRLNLPEGKKLHMSFREASDKYIERLELENGKDLLTKKYRLKHHLKPFFGTMQLILIKTFDIERYKKYRSDQEASNSSINRELAIVSHLMNKAVEWEWLLHKTCATRKMPEKNGRITYLTVKQAVNLLNAAQASNNPHIYLFIKIGLETGMRKMEILSIQISNIDLEQRTIYIPNAKAGDRVQPMTKGISDFLKNHLKNISKSQIWLFPSPHSRTGHLTEIRKSFMSAVIDAGLDPNEIVRHTLRHTAITHLIQAGVDLPTVKRISGHKTLRMVERYAHQNGEHLQSAMDLLEERYNHDTHSAE